MHVKDDKVLDEKNRKRTVKTPVQIQALENFYSENKYPSDMLKAEISEATSLTEKQVYGWFCHRRLKDKKLYDSSAGGLDHSSAVVEQDHGSGHRPDSCGSTKLGGNRNFDTKEVESGRVILPQHSGVELAFSGTSRYLPPKSPLDMPAAKPRSGPSGYLKLLKRPSENPAITAVKKQLGTLYTEDGPTLGVDFDSLPPGSFESKQVQVYENYGTREGISPALGGISNLHQHLKFGKGFEIGSRGPSLGLKMDRASFKVPQGSDGLHISGHQKFKQNSSPGYYSDRSLGKSAKGVAGSDIRDDFATRYRHGVEDTQLGFVLGGKVNEVQESSFSRHSGASRKKLPGEYIEHLSTTTCTNESDNVWTLALPRRGSAKASKRPLEGLPPPPQQPLVKKQSVASDCIATNPAIRPGGEPGIGGSASDEKEAKSGAEKSSCVE
ncbi:uncharacterized protein LOC127259006 isoform X2 [Andrographis paniculata]|nr:uncharacterized protein LOC127259006 isoform X2 [Andrographis paniculata]XP_051142079.1 uncharacterized protein LOC127259006 isoform X2 [Andrographis paniculata]